MKVHELELQICFSWSCEEPVTSSKVWTFTLSSSNSIHLLLELWATSLFLSLSTQPAKRRESLSSSLTSQRAAWLTGQNLFFSSPTTGKYKYFCTLVHFSGICTLLKYLHFYHLWYWFPPFVHKYVYNFTPVLLLEWSITLVIDPNCVSIQ